MTASPAQRLSGLDTLRALAIIAVMLYHLTIFGELPERFLPVTYYGWMGVDLFFVLSGFLIGQQVLRPYARGERPGIREFYRRRAYRILPPYLVVLALYIFVPWFREAPRLAPLWKFFTFTMNLGFHFDRRCFSHAWSLCVEEQFYLLLPLATMLWMQRPSVRRTVAAIAMLVTGGVLLRLFLVAHYPDEVNTRVYYPTYTRLDPLLAGLALASMRTFRPGWWERLMQRGHALLLVGTVCIGSVVFLFRHQDLGSNVGPAKWGVIVGFPVLALGLGMIVASSVSVNGWLSRTRVPGAEWIASLAFSLYLTHKAVANLVLHHVPRITAAQGPLSWLCYAVACLAAAVLLHVLVERPCLRLRDRQARLASSATLEDVMRRDPAL